MAAGFHKALRHPVTTGICLMAVGISLRHWQGWSIDPLVLAPEAFSGEPWRLLTSVLPHGDLLHLAFNLMWFWSFGHRLEEHYGSAAFAGMLVPLAAGSGAAEYALFAGGIGLSGVVYGQVALLWMLQRAGVPNFVDSVSRPTAVLFIAWFFICIAATVGGVWRIANVAHGMGAVLGAILGWGLAARRRRALAVLVGLLVLVGIGFAATRGRESINSAHGSELFAVADRAFQQKDYRAAAEALARAVRRDPRQADWWYNLGVAHQHLGQRERAVKAFKRALAAPATEWMKGKGLQQALSYLGRDALARSAAAEAVRYLARAVAQPGVRPDEWYLLGSAHEQLGQLAAARKAYERVVRIRPKDEAARTALARVITALATTTQPVERPASRAASQPTSAPTSRPADADGGAPR